MAGDFTEDYWPLAPAGSTCKTAFAPLLPPTFTTDKDTTRKSVVRSNSYQEKESGQRTFSGNVKVLRDDLLLTSQHLDWNDEESLKFEQGLSLYHEQGAMAIKKAEFKFEVAPRVATLDSLEFVLFPIPLQGSFKHLKADDSIVEANGFNFSTCDPRAERWGLKVNRIRVNRETSRITLRGIKFQIGRVPLFYMPYFTFRPQNEKDGVDTTRIRYRSDNGIILEQPIKFVRQDSRLQFAPRYLSKNGLQLTAEARWRDLSTSVDWTPDDKKIDGSSSTSIDPSRWRVRLNHQYEWEGWESEIDFTQTSDFAYQHDFEFDSLTQPQFATSNTARLTYSSLNHRLSLGSQRFESTSEDAMLGESYPELDYEWNPNWQWFSMKSKVNAASYRNPNLQSHRGYFEQALETRVDPIWGSFLAGASTSRGRFELDDGEASTTWDRSISRFHLGGSLNFDKTHANSLYTVMPRLFYSKRSFTEPIYSVSFDSIPDLLQSTQIFGSNRTASLNRIPGEHRLASGFSVHINPFDQSAHRFEADLAHLHHFDGIDGQSPSENAWAMAVSVKTGGGFLLEHRQYRMKDQSLANQHATLLVVEPRVGTSVYASLGRHNQKGSDQSEFGFRLPLSGKWETVGAINYDWQTDKIAEAHAGFLYNGCCYQATFLAQRALDWDFRDGAYTVGLENRFMIRFKLTGLGSLGRNRIESLLQRKQFGFHTIH